MIFSIVLIYIFSSFFELRALSPDSELNFKSRKKNLAHFVKESIPSSSKTVWDHFNTPNKQDLDSHKKSRISQLKNKFLDVEDHTQISKKRKTWLYFKAVYNLRHNIYFSTISTIIYALLFIFIVISNFMFDLHLAHILTAIPIYFGMSILTIFGIVALVLYLIPHIIEHIILKSYRIFKKISRKNRPSFLEIIGLSFHIIALVVDIASWIAVSSGSIFLFMDMFVGMAFEFVVIAFIQSISKAIKKRNERKRPAQILYMDKKINVSINDETQSLSFHDLVEKFKEKAEDDRFIITVDYERLYGFSGVFLDSDSLAIVHHHNRSFTLKRGDPIPRSSQIHGHQVRILLTRCFITDLDAQPVPRPDISDRYVHIFEIIFFIVVLIVAFILILYSLSSHTFIVIPQTAAHTHSAYHPTTQQTVDTADTLSQTTSKAVDSTTTEEVPHYDPNDPHFSTDLILYEGGIVEIRPGFALHDNRFSESFFYSSYLAVNFIVISIGVGALPALIKYLLSKNKKAYIKNSNSLIPPHSTLFDLQSTLVNPFSPFAFKYIDTSKEESLFSLAQWAFTSSSEIALRMRNYLQDQYPDLVKKFNPFSRNKLEDIPNESPFVFEPIENIDPDTLKRLNISPPSEDEKDDRYILYNPDDYETLMSCRIRFNTIRHNVAYELLHSFAHKVPHNKTTYAKKGLGRLFFKSDYNFPFATFPVFITDEDHIPSSLRSTFRRLPHIPIITGIPHHERPQFIQFLQHFNNPFMEALQSHIKQYNHTSISFKEIKAIIENKKEWHEFWHQPSNKKSLYHVGYLGSSVEDIPCLAQAGDYAFGFSSSIIHKNVEDNCSILFRSQSVSLDLYYSIYSIQKTFVPLVIFLFLFAICFTLLEALLIFLFQDPFFSHIMNAIIELSIAIVVAGIFISLVLYIRYNKYRSSTHPIEQNHIDFDTLFSLAHKNYPDHQLTFLSPEQLPFPKKSMLTQHHRLVCLDVSILDTELHKQEHYFFPIYSSSSPQTINLTLTNGTDISVTIVHNKTESDIFCNDSRFLISSSIQTLPFRDDDIEENSPSVKEKEEETNSDTHSISSESSVNSLANIEIISQDDDIEENTPAVKESAPSFNSLAHITIIPQDDDIEKNTPAVKKKENEKETNSDTHSISSESSFDFLANITITPQDDDIEKNTPAVKKKENEKETNSDTHSISSAPPVDSLANNTIIPQGDDTNISSYYSLPSRLDTLTQSPSLPPKTITFEPASSLSRTISLPQILHVSYDNNDDEETLNYSA